jgi:hypothetical protein
VWHIFAHLPPISQSWHVIAYQACPPINHKAEERSETWKEMMNVTVRRDWMKRACSGARV